jgi:putative mycofactocin binding protein MftB
MRYRLARGVQVRKEDWGLLFYSQGESKIYFAKSGDWLHPLYSGGTSHSDSLYYNEADGTETPSKVVEHSIQKLITYLVERGIIVNEP